jgi:hypothetical protein
VITTRERASGTIDRQVVLGGGRRWMIAGGERVDISMERRPAGRKGRCVIARSERVGWSIERWRAGGRRRRVIVFKEKV